MNTPYLGLWIEALSRVGCPAVERIDYDGFERTDPVEPWLKIDSESEAVVAVGFVVVVAAVVVVGSSKENRSNALVPGSAMVVGLVGSRMMSCLEPTSDLQGVKTYESE